MKSGNKLTERINTLIDHDRFFEAMNTITEHDRKGVCRPMLAECATTYKYMLAYFERSTPETADPARETMVAQIREQLRRTADMLEIATLEPSDPGIYFSTRRTRGITADTDIHSILDNVRKAMVNAELVGETGNYNLQVQRGLEEAADKLFMNVWTTPHITKSEHEDLDNLLKAGTNQVNFPVQSLVLSSLLMGCLMYYDNRKLELLMDTVTGNDDVRIRARALCGTLLVLRKHSSRIKEDTRIMHKAEALADNGEVVSGVRKFVPLMLRTIDTDRVNKRVNEDIFPELMRMKPDIEKSMRRMGTKLDAPDMEENPDWEDILAKSGIADKLKELTEMQMDGADIFMSAFSQMKGFAFFRRTSNWFMPFDKNNSEVKQAAETVPQTLLQLLTKGNYFCSSDKYSMILALSKMPPAQFSMMTGQISEQMESMREDIESSLSGMSQDIGAEMALYLKDLYRYFRIKNEDTADPFEDVFELADIPPYQSLHTDQELLRGMAEFYFKYGYWSQAEALFGHIGTLTENADEDILQKRGYCLQLLGKGQDALRAYMQAELLNPESDWLLKRIATLLRDMKRYEEAASYARRALDRKPDNLQLEMLLGTLLMLANHPQEALKSFYKIKYLKPDNTKVLRPIAWCEFLLGNFDKSSRMYENMSDMQASDMLNCGHAMLAQGNISGSKRCYRECIALLPEGVEEFRKLFAEDRNYLLEAGVTNMDISLAAELATASDTDLAI